MTHVLAGAWALPVEGAPIRDGAVAWGDGGAICDVGPLADVLARWPAAAVERFPTGIVLPGLVNAHSHLEYATYGGFGDGLPFGPWLADHLRRKRRLTPEHVRASAELGVLETLRSGVTTIADCAYDGVVVDAARDAGLRGIVYLEAFGGPDADADAVVGRLADRLGALAERTGPLVALGASPHAPYTVAPHVLAALLDHARAHGLPVATHLAESAAELDALRDGSGAIAERLAAVGVAVPVLGEHPVRRLARDGVLAPGVVAIHCVQVGPEEIDLLAASGAAVAHCPRSNALLGCGTAPLRALLDAGVPVGIGSDSPSSAIDLDQWSELRAALLGARAREADPTALGADEVLRLATRGGAHALGLGDRVGALAPGLRADVIVVDLGGSPWWPVEDPAVAVVLGGSPERVALTVIDGVVRYRSGADDQRGRDARARAAAAREAMIDGEG